MFRKRTYNNGKLKNLDFEYILLGGNKNSLVLFGFDFGYFYFLPKGYIQIIRCTKSKKITKKLKKGQVKIMKARKHEGGITLIALVITIIILVIISAIVIKTITGDNDLLATTTAAADKYKISEYKEMISAQVTGVIQANMMKGEGTTLGDIAEALEEKLPQVTTANVYADDSMANEDILVTMEDGYVFQVFYSDLYNVFFVEFIGKGNETDFPSVSASYSKTQEKATISASRKWRPKVARII